MYLMKITMALIFIFNIHMVKAQNLTAEDLRGAQIVLLTAPSWCGYCRILEAKLEETGNTDSINLTVNGEVISIPITRIGDDADSTVLSQNGFTNESGYPSFSLVRNGRVLIPDESPLILNSDNYNIDVVQPHEGESYVDYNDRFSEEMERAAVNISVANFENAIREAMGENVERTFSQRVIIPNRELRPIIRRQNVLIAGTATSPIDNAEFTPTVIAQINQTFREIVGITPTILHGFGTLDIPDSTSARSASENEDDLSDGDENGVIQTLRRTSLGEIGSFNHSNLAGFFEAARNGQAQRNLLVFVGHGSEQGAIAWFENPIMPDELRLLNEHSGIQNVLVSGNCYGGVMANSVSCGFFAAPPTQMASGCWTNPEDVVKDYTSEFFSTLRIEPRSLVDLNGDGDISFNEAHLYSIFNAEVVDTPYSTQDAIADQFFADNPMLLLNTMSVTDIKNLANEYSNREEREEARRLFEGVNDANLVNLMSELSFENESLELNLRFPFDMYNSEFKLRRNIPEFEAALERLRNDGIDLAAFSNTSDGRIEAASLRCNHIVTESMSYNSDDNNNHILESIQDREQIAISCYLDSNLDTVEGEFLDFSIPSSYFGNETDKITSAINQFGDYANMQLLARRLLMQKHLHGVDNDFSRRLSDVTACGNQSIVGFLSDDESTQVRHHNGQRSTENVFTPESGSDDGEAAEGNAQ